MKDLIAKLEKLATTAQGSLAMQSPAEHADVGYHFGKLQGRYKGILEALKAVEDYLNDMDEQNDER